MERPASREDEEDLGRAIVLILIGICIGALVPILVIGLGQL